MPRRNACEKADRAVQAFYGLLIMGGEPDQILHLLTEAFREIADLQTAFKNREPKSYFETRIADHQSQFVQAYLIQKREWLPESPEAAWEMFYEGFDLATLQLRLFPAWVDRAGCLEAFAKRWDLDPRELISLPYNTTLIVRSDDFRQLHLDVENPVRLSVLDCVLQYRHCYEVHLSLVAAHEASYYKADWQRTRFAQLDSYARQTICAAVVAIETMFHEYNQLLQHMAKETKNRPERFDSLAVEELSKKVKRFHTLWRTVEPAAPCREHTLEEEVLKLIEVRNRLVHPDGRETAWEAYRINIAMKLGVVSQEEFLKGGGCALYGQPGTHIGYEFSSATRAVDIMDRFLRYMYWSAFSGCPDGVFWLNLPRDERGALDHLRLWQLDRMLEVPAVSRAEYPSLEQPS